MTKDYQVMPELSADEYAELKADIAERGVMVPIELDEDGNILDGYNRKKICDELGITDYPKVVRAGMSEEEKLTHARKLNLARRHLSQDQKRELIRDQIKATPGKSDRQMAEDLGVDHKTVARQRTELEGCGEIPHAEKTTDTLGRMQPRQRKLVSAFNPSSREVEALKDPDIQRRLSENDKINVAGAIREQTRENLIEHLESLETKEAKALAGVYDVIVVDPPWPMQKIERDERPQQSEFDYPTMTIEEIKSLKIPAADDCHLFLWTTQRFLPDAFDVLKYWGFRYDCTFVWHKMVGYKPIGLPMFNCEFALYARKGRPSFVDEKQFWTCFEAPSRGHSVKPDEFYDLIRRVTAGRRLDMFNRRRIDGFDSWGKEAAE